MVVFTVDAAGSLAWLDRSRVGCVQAVSRRDGGRQDAAHLAVGHPIEEVAASKVAGHADLIIDFAVGTVGQ